MENQIRVIHLVTYQSAQTLKMMIQPLMVRLQFHIQDQTPTAELLMMA
jgi:hypothetical protein